MTAQRSEELVDTLVSRPAVHVGPDATLRSVAEVMDGEGIGALVVHGPLRPGRGTQAIGLVSERDLVRALADGADPDTTRVEDVMTVDLESIGPRDSALDAARRMVASDVRHLPVVEDDAVVGIVSARDALRLLAAD